MRHVNEVKPTKFSNMRDAYLQALEEMAKPHPSATTATWPQFNEMTGGFRAREFSIICGPTGCGKTTFLSNLSAQLLMANVRHFVMSVETGYTDFMKRIISVFAGDDLNTGYPISVDKLSRIHMQHAKHLESDAIEFSLYEDRVPIEQLKHDIVEMSKKGCKVVMIDNLNFFMEVTRSADTIVEMDRVVHELIILCKQIDVHILMVMHPKKTDGGRIEHEFDIKGSSTAVQEAHNIFLFNKPRPEDIKSGFLLKSDRELKIQKMRRRGGNVGKTIVFSNIGTQYRESKLLE